MLMYRSLKVLSSSSSFFSCNTSGCFWPLSRLNKSSLGCFIVNMFFCECVPLYFIIRFLALGAKWSMVLFKWSGSKSKRESRE